MFDIDSISVPRHPGIYIMRDGGGAVIYIGKAKDLRRRVRSYFNRTQDYKTARLVQSVGSIEFVLTDTESEAYLLESGMIKRHRPKFNIELKDQERYTYLRVTDEEYPRLVVARRSRSGRFLGKGSVYGPFVYGSSKLLTIGTLRKAFKIRTCKRLPKSVCLEYHLGNCEGPCEFGGAQQRYAGHVGDLEEVLKSADKAAAFAERLRADMEEAAGMRQFERAREIRDTLRRLGSLQDEQKMSRTTGGDEEFFGVRIRDMTATVMNFRMVAGVIRDSDRFVFETVGDNNLGNFLYQYYTTHPIPDRIILNQVPAERQTLAGLLGEQAGHPVSMILPDTEMRRNMIKLLLKNIDSASSADPHLRLQKALNLESAPRRIECFDISNHGEEFAVGAMSHLADGRPEKSRYRRFRIRSVRGRDDYAMMYEVVLRRYSRLKREEKPMPDLVLIDGGLGQLGRAAEALQKAGANLPCVSLAKENEEVYVLGKSEPVVMPPSEPALHLLQYARDEAHRFGVAYNASIRRSKLK